ncbi:hypothetical protein [Comamonas sp. JUb58]|uniref:hypothetical protein n=1 Tax=Comamonas sp. JUb58 TaxID=2485114 RepID=UPI00105C7729|nr:hypothetical protein [Comamonas sp. JUb58]TDS74381.1 hypothetical protein EDF71_11761 [Comamonas sp. JUb58]
MSNELTTTALGTPSINDAALALFTPLEADMTALAAKYHNVAYDMTTTKGAKAARDARLELRESGRFAIQRLRDQTKGQLNDCKTVIETEATRLIAIVEPAEVAIDKQIKAHEQKLADEKAAKEKAEAERVQKHTEAIATIAGYSDKARGLPVERIEAGIAYVRGIDVSAAVFEEFADRAAAEKAATIGRLEQMAADRRSADAAEAQRQENERVAAELAAQQRKLDEQAAELARQRQALAPAPQAAPVAEPVAEPVAAPAAAPAPAPGAAARPAPAAMPQPAARAAAGAAPATEVDTDASVSLGQIKTLIAPLSIDAAGLEQLGFPPVATDKSKRLYRACDLPAIRDAMVQHLLQVDLGAKHADA